MGKGLAKKIKLGPAPPHNVGGVAFFAEQAKTVAATLGDKAGFDKLEPAEKANVLAWLSEGLVDGNVKTPMHRALWEHDYEREPVDIETFITDPYYFGHTCAELDDNWINDLKVVFAPGSQIAEWVMTGSIGCGKTTVAMTALGYKIYLMSCLRDPAAYYGLLADSLIIFGIYSITKKQVADTGYFKLRGFLDTSPYFKNIFPRSKKIDSKVVFERRNMQVIPGSRELHALGLDLFTFSMDEVNFMQERADKDRGKIVGQAYDLYNATSTRILSRFMRPGGTIPGMTFLMSSRNAQTSFLEQHLKKVTKAKTTVGLRGPVGDHTFVSDYALWEIRAHRYVMPKFRVEVGDRVSRSRILKADEEPRRGGRIVEVPGDLRAPFEEDTDQALRDIAGVATFNLSPLVRDRESVFAAVRPQYKHPFKREAVTISTDDDLEVVDYFKLKTICRVKKGRWVPRINPSCPRFMHVDTSLTGDCTGIAMAHASGVVRRRDMRPDGTFSVEAKPYIIVDFMLRVMPPPGAEIALHKVRKFIYYLRDIFTIAGVSFDGYQSRDSKQLIQKEGFTCEIVSVDKSSDPYISLRSAFFDRRIVTYHYPPFIDEFLDLEYDIKSRKVDHPNRSSRGTKGSKDVSDAVAGACWWCLTDPRAQQHALAMMAQSDEFPDERTVAPKPEKPGEAKPESKNVSVAGTKLAWEKLAENL